MFVEMRRLLLFLTVIITVACGSPCGSPSSFSSDKWYHRVGRSIIGGNEVPVGKWPWQVMLRRMSWANYEPINGTFDTVSGICGGTVISNRWILTAAHCFNEPIVTTLVYSGIIHGNRARDRTIDEKGVISVVQEVLKHPNYTAGLHDLALLKLEEPIHFDESVSPICLPPVDKSIPEDGQAVTIGYGLSNVRNDNDSLPLIRDYRLRETTVPLIRMDICKSRLAEMNSVRNRAERMTSSTHVCAGSYGHGMGKGDSGGPLLMRAGDGRWFQIGIASFGGVELPLAQDINPGVYTNIKEYCDWIKQTTNGEASCQEETVTLKDVEINV